MCQPYFQIFLEQRTSLVLHAFCKLLEIVLRSVFMLVLDREIYIFGRIKNRWNRLYAWVFCIIPTKDFWRDLKTDLIGRWHLDNRKGLPLQLKSSKRGCVGINRTVLTLVTVACVLLRILVYRTQPTQVSLSLTTTDVCILLF